jgi:hypothetical protein
MVNSVKASVQGLEIVDKARKKKGWTKKTPIWWQTAFTSEATLKRFWEKRRINRETFIRICETVGISNWQEIADMSAAEASEHQIPIQDWGEAPDVCGFFGRTEELSLLGEWIVNDNDCRMVAVCGIAGIGKTYLAATLAVSVQDKFDYLFWRSLRSAPPIENVLTDLLRFFGSEKELSLTQGFNYIVSQLIHFLRNNRCLIVFDDFDAVLQSGERAGFYLEGYEGYGELLKRLGDASTKSCLLLMSREKPKEITSTEGEAVPIRCIKLTGLQPPEAKEILRDKELSDWDDWEKLIKIYRGHPLALQIVSTIIQELFNGSVTEYLKQNTIVLGDIGILLSQQFQRLSSLEKEIMYWLALNRQPVSKLQLLKYTELNETSPLLEVLTSLGWRSLIERTTENGEVLFLLQPMVMKYVTNEFVTQVCREIHQGKLEVLKSHALVIQHQGQNRKVEFPYRPIMSMVKDRLTKQFGNKTMLIEGLNNILYILKDNPAIETGYAKDNILNLLAELNHHMQSTIFLYNRRC